MSYEPDFFLSETENFQDKDYETFLNTWNKTYEKIARQVNVKDFGYYSTEEMVNGQRWSKITSGVQEYKTVYRKRFDFTTITQGGTETIKHGISGFTLITRSYGEVITDVVDYRSIPYTSISNVNLGIQITKTATEIIIVNGSAAPAISSGFVVLEYIY